MDFKVNYKWIIKTPTINLELERFWKSVWFRYRSGRTKKISWPQNFYKTYFHAWIVSLFYYIWLFLLNHFANLICVFPEFWQVFLCDSLGVFCCTITLIGFLAISERLHIRNYKSKSFSAFDIEDPHCVGHTSHYNKVKISTVNHRRWWTKDWRL